VKKYGIKYIISLDRDFMGQEEYRKPRQFVELIYGESKESDFYTSMNLKQEISQIN